MAVIEWLPTDREEVAKVAAPPLSVPVPRVVKPSLKVTVPLGVPAPGATGLTVAVKITDWPNTEGLAEEVTVVVVSALLTVNVPLPVARSLVDVAALTAKVVVPAGVALVVLTVSVDIFELSAGANETGFGENKAVAPAGSDVVMLRVTVKAPVEPPPLPRFAVTV